MRYTTQQIVKLRRELRGSWAKQEAAAEVYAQRQKAQEELRAQPPLGGMGLVEQAEAPEPLPLVLPKGAAAATKGLERLCTQKRPWGW